MHRQLRVQQTELFSRVYYQPSYRNTEDHYSRVSFKLTRSRQAIRKRWQEPHVSSLCYCESGYWISIGALFLASNKTNTNCLHVGNSVVVNSLRKVRDSIEICLEIVTNSNETHIYKRTWDFYKNIYMYSNYGVQSDYFTCNSRHTNIKTEQHIIFNYS